MFDTRGRNTKTSLPDGSRAEVSLPRGPGDAASSAQPVVVLGRRAEAGRAGDDLPRNGERPASARGLALAAGVVPEAGSGQVGRGPELEDDVCFDPRPGPIRLLEGGDGARPPDRVAAHDHPGVRTEELQVAGRSTALCARRAGRAVADHQVVLAPDTPDRASLILDEEPLAAVVVQVVAAIDEVVPHPHRLQAVAVVAVLPDVGELVVRDQGAGAVTVRVVVPVQPDRVLAERADELVADDRDVVDRRGRGRAGVDAEVAAADAVVGDGHA